MRRDRIGPASPLPTYHNNMGWWLALPSTLLNRPHVYGHRGVKKVGLSHD